MQLSAFNPGISTVSKYENEKKDNHIWPRVVHSQTLTFLCVNKSSQITD